MSDKTENVLEIEGLRFGYDDKPLLDIKKFHLKQDERVALIGPSGCGKTTFIHLVSGLIRPDYGVVRLAGQDITRLSEQQVDRVRGQQVGIIFQNLHLMPAISVLDNLLLAQRLARAPIDKNHALELLERLGISEKAGELPGSLSQGQAQRAAIARAVAHKPKLLIGDEPTSALDKENAETAINLLSELSTSHHFALLIVTHDERVSAAMDRVIRLGEIS